MDARLPRFAVYAALIGLTAVALVVLPSAVSRSEADRAEAYIEAETERQRRCATRQARCQISSYPGVRIQPLARGRVRISDQKGRSKIVTRRGG